MEQKPFISNISIYPVKSLDGISVQKAQIGNGGSLHHDREYAIKDGNNKFVNGKSNALVHLLRMNIDFEKEIISFRHQDETNWHAFHLQQDKAAIDDYLSTFFKMPVSLHKNTAGRFLDIPDISGMTIVSTASLQTVSGWFNDLDLDETRKRFRATLEIADVPAFWEDWLFFDEAMPVEFKIGNITIMGMSPRARCVVPTRHPETGEVIHAFQKSFAQHRTADLPQGSTLPNYGHGYFLSVDCLIPQSEFGKWIAIGDEVKVIGKKSFPTFMQL